MEWPQQSRIVEIVVYDQVDKDGNGMGEIITTMLDHYPVSPDPDLNTLSENGRIWALQDPQIMKDKNGWPAGGGTVADRNRVLPFLVPAKVMAEIRELPHNEVITSYEMPGGEPL